MTTISSIDARFAQDQVGIASREVSSSVANLVTGRRTDANVSDLSVGTILSTRVDTLRVTIANAGQAQSLLETARGALDTTLSLLQQQNNLAVRAGDDSLTDNERGFLNQEFQAIVSEINRIAESANFNGQTLIDGSLSGTAGIATATSLANDNFSLISAGQFSTSVTGEDTNIATGNLLNTAGTEASAILSLGTGTGTADATVVTLSQAGFADETITFTNSATDASVTAANFQAALDAATGPLARAFEVTDTANGDLIISTREATSDFNNVTFEVTTPDGVANATFGGDDIDAGGGPVSFATATTATLGSEGIISYVDANRIGETRAEATVNIATAASNSDTIQFTIVDNDGAVADAGDTVTVTFTASGATSANEQIEDLLSALSNGTDSASISGTGLSFGGSASASEREALLQSFVFELDGPSGSATALSIQASENGATNLDNVTFSLQNVTDGATLDATINGSSTVGSFGDSTSQIFSEEVIIAAAAGNSEAGTLTITDVNGVLGNAGDTVVIGITTSGATSAAEQFEDLARIINTASDSPTGLAGSGVSITGTGNFTADATLRENLLNALTLTSDGDGTGQLTGTVEGLTFEFAGAAYAAATDVTIGAANAGAATPVALDTAVAVTATQAGTDRTVSDADLTFDANLIGQITDITANFNAGTVDGSERNSVTFTATVGGRTFVSEEIFLQGEGTAGTIGAAGDQIRANEQILFFDPDGSRNSSDVLSDNGFALNVGSSAISLADTSTISRAQDSLDTIATELQTQLNSVTVNQTRTQNFELVNPSSGDFRIQSAVGTLLEGLQGFDAVGNGTNDFNQGDIRFTDDAFASTGELGSIGSFTVDRLTDTISTTIDGETFTAYLNSTSAPTTGGVVAFGTNVDGSANAGSYNPNTSIIDLDSGAAGVDSARLTFFSESETDGRVLEIDLGNVAANTAQLNISTDEGQTALANALNTALGVAANDSLTFQVGAESTDVIGVSIGSARTTDIYRDDEGAIQTLSIATSEQATVAAEVLDNAIREVVSLLSDISASITSFNSAIQNNQSSVQNADAARSTLLDTDFTSESTRFAEARVRVDAATAILTQVNSRIQNLLQLLQQ